MDTTPQVKQQKPLKKDRKGKLLSLMGWYMFRGYVTLPWGIHMKHGCFKITIYILYFRKNLKHSTNEPTWTAMVFIIQYT